MATGETARGKLLDMWDPPPHAGGCVGCVATTFTFDADFFEEELLGRFLGMETSAEDGRAYLIEREERLGQSPAYVLADRRHLSRSTTLAWDLLPVSVPGGACQHSKIAILAWERVIRLIAGSANLTKPAYRHNLECFAAFDFVDDGEVPREILVDALDFLRRTLRRVSDPADNKQGGSDTPRGRCQSLLETLRRIVRSLDLPDGWHRGSPRVGLAFLEPGRGEGVLDQMRGLWGNHSRPDWAAILSPFWTDSGENGTHPVADTLIDQMSPKGEVQIDFWAPGERELDDRWVVQLPRSMDRWQRGKKRVSSDICAVPSKQYGEIRPLHAKAIWLGRREGRQGSVRRELLVIGSSNATIHGLGIGRAPRNLEANIAFVIGDDRKLSGWFDECFPDHELVVDPAFIGADEDAPDDEGGAPPVPAFFGWAAIDQSESPSRIMIGLGEGEEPGFWSIEVEGTGLALSDHEYQEAGSPEVWTFVLVDEGKRSLPPAWIDVRWAGEGGVHVGILPVNAIGESSRCRPDLWSDIDLDALLDLLSKKGSVYRNLARALERRESSNEKGGGEDALDPHKRVNTSGFLMQTIRRFSLALGGLAERLSQPVHSETALEWRFQGPLAPRLLARRILKEEIDRHESRFLLAEILLTIGWASKKVRSDGVSLKQVKLRYAREIEDIASLLPPSRRKDLLASYVKRALAEASR